MEAPLSKSFFKKRMKKLSIPDGFVLYGELRLESFSTTELLHANMKIRQRIFRVRHNFYMISENPNASSLTVDCSLYTRRIALKDDYHKRPMDMLAFALVEFSYLRTLAKI